MGLERQARQIRTSCRRYRKVQRAGPRPRISSASQIDIRDVSSFLVPPRNVEARACTSRGAQLASRRKPDDPRFPDAAAALGAGKTCRTREDMGETQRLDGSSIRRALT